MYSLNAEGYPGSDGGSPNILMWSIKGYVLEQHNTLNTNNTVQPCYHCIVCLPSTTCGMFVIPCLLPNQNNPSSNWALIRWGQCDPMAEPLKQKRPRLPRACFKSHCDSTEAECSCGQSKAKGCQLQ